MSVLHVTEENFEQLRSEKKPVLLDFFAVWCSPCKMLSPLLEEIGAEHPEYVVAKIDVDESPALAAEFGVISIPTLVVLKNGEEVRRSTGARPKAQLLKLLED